MGNFISTHILSNIEKLVTKKQEILKHDGFLYFNEPIRDGKKIINRVNKYYPYLKEQILPSSWYLYSGKTLHEAFLKIKNNDFFVYKKINDRDCKVRLKRNG